MKISSSMPSDFVWFCNASERTIDLLTKRVVRNTIVNPNITNLKFIHLKVENVIWHKVFFPVSGDLSWIKYFCPKNIEKKKNASLLMIDARFKLTSTRREIKNK